MPTFLNSAENYLVTTSAKVMFSTLSRQPTLTMLRRGSEIVSRVWRPPWIRHYLIVRNPYDRLVSFYFDKFFTTPAQHGQTRWQHCQRLFFPALGLTGSEDESTVAERLKTTTFEEFVRQLPVLYQLDAHLRPQVWSLRVPFRKIIVPLRVSRRIKVEEDLDLLSRDLKLDVEKRENATTHEGHDRYFSRSTRAIANTLYRRDFERFGYPSAP